MSLFMLMAAFLFSNGHIEEVVAPLDLSNDTWVEIVEPPTMEDIIREVWPDNLEAKAIRVAHCESKLDPNVASASGKYIGLFQNDRNANPHGLDLRDPWVSSQEALRKYNSGGWAHWPICGRR